MAAPLAAAFTLAVTTAALAQAPTDLPDVPVDPGVAADPGSTNTSDLGQTCSDSIPATQGTGCDTELAPVAKETALWTQIGGQIFGSQGRVADGSPTPIASDLFAVSFHDNGNGFAGGTICADSSLEDQPLDACPAEQRVPAMYQYKEVGGTGGLWERAQLPGSDRPGFVGAIAWIGQDRALAVGGTGSYPRREEEIPGDAGCLSGATDPGKATPAGVTACEGEWRADHDPAGKARAWLFASGRWCELGSESTCGELPGLERRTGGSEPMRALTALDCTPRPETDHELCFAGGLQQLWEWRDGSFTQGWSPSSVDAQGNPLVDRASEWRFRVRALRFMPGEDLPKTQVVAATAGCCSELPSQNNPRLLVFDGHKWAVRLIYDGVPGQLTQEQTQTIPDSLYSVMTEHSGPFYYAGLIATPGGPSSHYAGAEPASRVLGQIQTPTTAPPDLGAGVISLGPVGDSLAVVGGPANSSDSDVPREAANPNLSSMRLLAGDGDVAGPPEKLSREGPDTVMDWAVGVLRSSGQAIAYSTTTKPGGLEAVLVNPLECPGGDISTSNADKCTTTTADELQGQTRSSTLLKLGSYGLNAFQMVPGQTGTAWAVGDRGAIERLGGSGAAGAGSEGPPPKLGTPTPAPLPADSAYDEARSGADPSSNTVGAVPAQDSAPTVHVPHPEVVSAGSPDTSRSAFRPVQGVNSIAMSRDGSEGWAVGWDPNHQSPKTKATTLFHWDGARWTSCDPLGVKGVTPPDPKCSEFVGFLNYTNGVHTFKPVMLQTLARVPLENDSDPTNDDDFEVYAAGTEYRTNASDPERFVIAVYRNGRWELDDQAMATIFPEGGAVASANNVNRMAFTAPDDGWIVLADGSLYHFDGGTWRGCSSDPRECGDDPDQPRLPGRSTVSNPLDLTVSGTRVYLFGHRVPDAAGATQALGSFSQQRSYPIVIYKDPGRAWTDGEDTDGGGYDPGCASYNDSSCVPTSDNSQQGDVKSLSVAQNQGGGYQGWAAGTFGVGSSARPLLRLAPGEESRPTAWRPWTVDDSSGDYASRISAQTQLVTLPGPDSDGGRAFILATNYGSIFPAEAPLLSFDPARGRWAPEPTPFGLGPYHSGHDNEVALPQAAAPDNQGGLWLSIRRLGGDGFGRGVKAASNWFYHYTDEVPRAVFEDVRSPVTDGTQITSAAGSPDGSFWLTTASGTVYRYDRVTGWDRVTIPRWDPGRVVTRPSSALAVAVGPGGDGIVVGESGRIADISPSGVQLNRAAGAALCSAGSAPPCGTSRDLDAAAIAPEDGSAMVGGDDRALLWRQPGGDFHAITPPDTAPGATITGISLPTPEQAYVTTDQGEIFDGELRGGDWVWTLGDERSGALLSANATGDSPQLNAIAVDSGGEGFAVGNGGVILERSEGTWHRITQSLPLDDFQSVVLAANGTGAGALVGGTNGLVLTRNDGRFEVAHQADPYSGISSSIVDTVASRIVGMALLPGESPGEAEAWVAEQLPPGAGNRNPLPSGLLHYTSDSSDPLLNPGSRGAPLPDVSSSVAGGLSFAVFGKQDCSYTGSDPCPDQTGTNRFNEVVARHVADEIGAASERPGGPSFAVFSGDANDAGGREHASAQSTDASTAVATPADASVKHDDWIDQVARRFAAAGVPVLGAIGGQDLTGAKGCITVAAACYDPTPSTGLNLPWRQSMASMPKPWGSGSDPSSGAYEFRPVADGETSVQGQNQTIADPSGQAGNQTLPTGGARTHYAVDIVRDGDPVARLVFLDSSLKSLQAADPVQNPLEGGGGQLAWLQTALTRPPGEPAVVVSNAPNYTYGPGQTETDAADSAQLDSLFLQNHVSAVVSGRLGWNALYWTISAGLHWPCPGGSYPEHPGPPSLAEVSSCSQTPQGTPSPEAPDLSGSSPVSGALPTVISSSAGGKFAPDAQQAGSASSSNGYWHGYSIVHLDPSGDPAKTVVEQRPVFDWIALGSDPRTRGTHMVRAGQKLRLMGYGREPAGTDVPLRYDEISSPAITHRYDLLEADPAKPWLPRSGTREDDCDPFDCLDPRVGTINRQSGEVRAGNGAYPRTFAIAQLSVGGKSATYPVDFEPRASFQQPRPPTVPPVAVPAPPPAAAPPPAQTPTASLPPAPVLPVLAAQTPPPPPAPPAPPTFASQAPMDLSITPTAIDVAPPTAVSQPPTPPVNPAPPSGARREARQRQAAAQKSGADSDQESSDAQDAGGDMADGPHGPGHAATRHDFTAIADRSQPSAWTRDLLLGGGLGAAALILALGLGIARPKPRRRDPEVPALAWARQRRRG